MEVRTSRPRPSGPSARAACAASASTRSGSTSCTAEQVRAPRPTTSWRPSPSWSTGAGSRAFGTAQDEPDVIEAFAASPHCRTIQSQLNVFGWDPEVLDLAHAHGLAVLARSPLAMGLLSGKYRTDRRPAPGDVRLDTPWWDYFEEGSMEVWLGRLDQVRELLTTGGRSLVQGSLAYLWALDPAVVPLPGIRTPEQARENAGALAYGPLPVDVAAEVTTLLADSPERRSSTSG